MAVGGPIKNVILEGRYFDVEGDNEVEMFSGGWTNEVTPNGNGSGRIIKTPKTGEANKLPIIIDDDRGDEEFIKELRNRHSWIKASFTDINDNTFSGDVQIVGDSVTNKKTMVMEIDLKARDVFTKQN